GGIISYVLNRTNFAPKKEVLVTTGFIAKRLSWLIICTVAGILAAFAWEEAQIVKSTVTVVEGGGLLSIFIPFFAFWAAIAILLIAMVQFFRK
ncbi:MAG TPA: hypothetical protein VJ481_01580, partial [Patescibacteria group bacterium]|nr:hypothetical protein [Patescibacteria group bacterium]